MKIVVPADKSEARDRFLENPDKFRSDLLEANLPMRSMILIVLGGLMILGGFLTWKGYLPDPIVQKVTLHENLFIYGGITFLAGIFAMQFLMFSAAVLIGLIAYPIIFDFAPGVPTFLGVSYSWWGYIAGTVVLILIIFLDVAYGRRKEDEVKEEIEEYIKTL